MSIASEITRINTNIANAYTALGDKGATMPQEQNSANLASAIDTITTGGGGNSYEYSEDFDTVTNIMRTEVPDAGMSYQSDLTNPNTWTMVSSSYFAGYSCMGLVFSKDVPHIIWNDSNNYLRGLKYPNGATYEKISDKKYKVTFGNDGNWVCLLFSSSLAMQSVTSYLKFDDNNYAYPIAIYSKAATGASSTSACGFDSAKKMTRLRAIRFREGFKFSDDLYPYLYPALFQLDNISEFIKYLNSYNATTDSITFTGSRALQVCGLSAYSGSDYMNIIPMLKDDMNVIFDLSSATLTGTAYLIQGNGAYTPPMVKLKKLKIILPSSYSKVSLLYTRYNVSNFPLYLDNESLKFMADNAPTVSSKTLEMEYSMYYRLNGTTEGQEILSTFTSKGWTVTGT